MTDQAREVAGRPQIIKLRLKLSKAEIKRMTRVLRWERASERAILQEQANAE